MKFNYNIKWNSVNFLNCIEGMQQIDLNSIDCIICDPPYNIGKDFGTNKTKKEITEYVNESLIWIRECERILKDSGTMFIYGFPEILAFLSVELELDSRWLAWHYTNKTTPSSKFWQRSHESIICAWKDEKKRIFNVDSVREPYTENFIKGYKGKDRKRPGTEGRFNKDNKETTYRVNELGALPRDVLKIPALAGGSGVRERIIYCKETNQIISSKQAKQMKDNFTIIKHPTQKPMELTRKILASCLPQEGESKVVIPFAGSGSECFVAEQLKGVSWVGFDLNKDFVDMANCLVATKEGHGTTKT